MSMVRHSKPLHSAMSTVQTPISSRLKDLTESAFILFSEHGLDQVRMDAIAKHAGVTKGSLYHHFSSKKEVIAAACDFYYAGWRKKMLEAVRPHKNPEKRLESAISASVKSCLLDKGNRVFTLEIMAQALHDQELKSSWSGFYASAKQFYIRLAQQCFDSTDSSTAEVVNERVELMLCTMEGIKLQSYFNPIPSSEELNPKLTASLLHTIIQS